MSAETIFYILGITLTVSAVVVSLLGLRSNSIPGKAFPLLALYFALLVAGTLTAAVVNAETNTTERTENQEAAQLLYGGQNTEADTGPSSNQQKALPKVKGPGGTVKLVADPAQLLYDTKKLSSRPGRVTIDFENPAQIEHNVAVAEGNNVLDQTDLITQGKTSVSIELAAGSYTFFCTVPGHREAGMEGTLTVE